MRQAGTLYFLFGDHLGSTSITVNRDGGDKRELRYKPWGGTRYSSGDTPTTYQFTGQRQEGYINLYWYGSRWYDTQLGRFIQPDTIVPVASQGVQAWDKYAGMNNNPVRYNDPTGHCPWCIGALIGGVIGAAITGATYAITNQGDSFNWGELGVALAGGAVAGALVGSGIGILAASTTTVLATTATAMVGAGAGAGGSAIGYTVTNSNSFETVTFAETTAVGGAIGGFSAITPLSEFGVAAKAATYIAGSETLYALQTDNWTVEGAQRAAAYGMVGAVFDVAGTYAVGGQPSSLASLYPSAAPLGYLPPPSYYDIMAVAASARAGSGSISAFASTFSGAGSSVSTWLVNQIKPRRDY
jgi:RHS repeat-associated protein